MIKRVQAALYVEAGKTKVGQHGAVVF